jgi:hypothetical protein
MKTAGLIYDDSRHFLDHLAPLCALLKWPLILCESTLADLARRYYPDLEVIEIPLWDLLLPETIVTCDTQPLLRAAFPGQVTKSLWLPHGNSDKGWNSPFFEALREDQAALVYGQKMIDFMAAKNVFPKTIRIGNFRWEYARKQEPFDLPQGRNFLYAPTWDDAENSCSFWQAFPHLARQLPADCNLLIKLHPNTLRRFEPELEVLMGRYAKQKNIVFLPEAPPIYPLLSKCDAYIGDMSSIGYDFLKFDKPMYFLNANTALPLHRCGAAIDAKTFDFSLKDDFAPLRNALYKYTFDSSPDWKEEIYALCGV